MGNECKWRMIKDIKIHDLDTNDHCLNEILEKNIMRVVNRKNIEQRNFYPFILNQLTHFMNH